MRTLANVETESHTRKVSYHPAAGRAVYTHTHTRTHIHSLLFDQIMLERNIAKTYEREKSRVCLG